jgi:hypothetical protein
MRIEAANTHPIWDPSWASQKLRSSNQQQIDLGQEIVRYGADLLLRSLASVPDADIANHVVLSVLFRDAIAAFDATMLSLEHGAIGAANVHARAQMEARWGLMLALGDTDKWGRHVFVASRREQRFQAARSVPGTPEFDAYAEVRTRLEAGGAKVSKPENAVRVAAMDRDLAKPEYAAINATFADFQKRRKRPARWYYDSSAQKPITGIRDLARFVGCGPEYETLYRHSSLYVHGAFTGTSVLYDPEKGLAVAPIRSPEGWRTLYIWAVSLACESFKRVMTRYRPGEIDVFARDYSERWRPVIQTTPDIRVTLGKKG